MDYWEESVSAALDEAGVVATSEQIKQIAGDIEVSHEQYGMAHGHDCIASPAVVENARLVMELERERRKTVCPECNGGGREIIQGPHHSGESDCFKCRGKGFLYWD